MEERIKRAMENHKKGYSCSQAVACAYCDLLGIDESLLFKMSEGFGLGMGALDTCGAVTGMFMVAGLAKSSGDLEHCNTKPSTMKLVGELRKAFVQKNQSVVCRELKGVDTKKPLRSCDGCIEDAIRIAGEMIFPKECKAENMRKDEEKK